jgi:hypothetical protein
VTSQPDESRDPVAAAQDLTGAVAGLADEVKRLRSYGRRNRAFIVFDVLLTILLAVTGVASVHAVRSANSANSAQLALCQAGNEARAQQIGLWTYVLSISKKPETAQQQKNIEAFKQHLNVIFAPRDCSHLGR